MAQAHPLRRDYYSAAVCLRGHVETIRLERDGADPQCGECGAAVITGCPHCSLPVRGAWKGDNLTSRDDFTPTNFCVSCGGVFPWAPDEALLYEIENRLNEQPDLAEGDRRQLLRRLSEVKKALGSANEENKMAEALLFIKDKAPAAFQAMLPAITSLATTVVKAQLGLPTA